MVQIVNKRKKGRPSKADLARRHSDSPDTKLRRSGRRRNVRYTFDFDDYLDEDFEDYVDEDEDEDAEERREKKLTLLLQKFQHTESPPSRTRQMSRGPTASPQSSDNYGSGSKPLLKKRKITNNNNNNNNNIYSEDDEDEDDDNDDEAVGQKVESKGVHSVPETPTNNRSLPEKKTLELILDKLQKKDIYGVYAEPVDPEELPDYHELIKNPMDFATVRKKLANGKYLTLEKFENDVLLICSNAMQYNAPDTIYHKQALSIQDLAKRKFQRLRTESERSEKEIKNEETIAVNSLPKSQIKRPMSRKLQEPVGSDFSSGATLAMPEDVQVGSSLVQASECEKPSSIDRRIDGNMSSVENIIDKGEELQQGKCPLSKLGKKASLNDENRRATYTISNSLITAPESTFTTFDGESRQLVPVGLHADHSYAWSLARFAATLGSVAWKVASHRIEQAVPAGFKFGRGWVGEYEPLSTPILVPEKRDLKEGIVASGLYFTADNRNEGKAFKNPLFGVENHAMGLISEDQPVSEAKSAITSSTSIQMSAEEPVRVTSLEGKPPFFCLPRTSHAATYQQQNSLPGIYVEPEQKVRKQVELNRPPMTTRHLQPSDAAGDRQIARASEVSVSRPVETVALNRNVIQSANSKPPDVKGGFVGSLPNGHVASRGLDSSRNATSTSNNLPKQRRGTANCFPCGQEQGLSDPVQLMRSLAEKAQQQHSSLNHSQTDTRALVAPSPPLIKEDSSNAAAAAARAWMSIGAGTFRPAAENSINHNSQFSTDCLYNAAREHQPQVSRFRGESPSTGFQFQADRSKFPLHSFVPEAARMGIAGQSPGQPAVYPQSGTPDLSRFQVQSMWRGLNPQTQSRQKQEYLPPDLNIGYQSSGSPGRQSSGILVDPQQPDLALQL